MRDESVEFKPETVTEIRNEMPMMENKGEMPMDETMKANYHNSFYPQYVDIKPDAYMARYTGDVVNGYDPTATYSKL